MQKSDIGVIGLGVMGSNLALNLEEKGFRVTVYNRTILGEETVTEDFIKGRAQGKNITGSTSLSGFVASLNHPRVILIMVKAGDAVDSVIHQLKPYLNKGDILIDGGNTHYADTGKRVKALSEEGIYFVGMGVSGGEEGARFGPSLMPGGNYQAWNSIEPVLKKISAVSEDGTPCCAWIGDEGAGHFVKMVHNGIEYADMQLIAEVYHIMRVYLNLNTSEISEIFTEWNKGDLNSYLLEITSDILKKTDDDGTPLVDHILDVAGQKGTGKWVSVAALDMGIQLPVITESVYARFISTGKELRIHTSKMYPAQHSGNTENYDIIIKELKQSFLLCRMIILSEGYYFINTAGKQLGWNINLPEIAQTWRKGCIIRSSLLKTIITSYKTNPGLQHLLHASEFRSALDESLHGLRSMVSRMVQAGIPIPAISSALSEFEQLRTDELPANLIQAQRDYFGAHQYERKDQPRGIYFHSNWKYSKQDR